MNPAAWTRFSGWMRDNGLISALPPAGSALSNSYLPSDEIPE
jgi:hypothetical protein